jgi:hypothetical protein
VTSQRALHGGPFRGDPANTPLSIHLHA